MTAIIFDIETIPSQAPGARDHIRATLKPPGTLKKPESIAAWWKDDSEAAVEAEYRKLSLDGGLHGEIISIACCADGHDKTWSYCRKQGEPEGDLLTAFFAVVEYWQAETARALLATHHDASSAWPMDEPHPVAHNAAFDLPYVWRRARVLGVPVPRWLPSPANLRTLGHSPNATCTMEAWAGRGGRVSLDSLCKALGVATPKVDLDGSQVFDAWLRGEYERLQEYNLRDALATREVWQRLQGASA